MCWQRWRTKMLRGLVTMRTLTTLALLFCLSLGLVLIQGMFEMKDRSGELNTSGTVVQLSDKHEEMNLIRQIVRRYPNISETEKTLFLSLKRADYEERRKTIVHYCRSSKQKIGEKIFNNTLVYDRVDKVSYCMIAKAASSTWSTQFINLGNPGDRIRHQYRNALQLLAPMLFPPPADPVAVWNDTTSIVVVRHPLGRLASVYQQKFVELASNAGWGRLNRRIIQMYGKGRTSEDDVPTPEEAILYVISNIESGLRVDQHWRPQHNSCPFCLMQFSIYAKVEEMEEDTLFFILESGLENRLSLSTRVNPSKYSEGEFWSQVSNQTIARLVQAYRLDFLMFGYSPVKYFREIRVPVHQQSLSLN